MSITKELCQQSIDKVKDGVCPGCGGIVEPLSTVDNSGTPTYWAGCNHCSVFTHPVEKRIFNTANSLLENGEYVYEHQPYDVGEERLEYWRDTERRAICAKLRRYLTVYEEQPDANPTPYQLEGEQ